MNEHLFNLCFTHVRLRLQWRHVRSIDLHVPAGTTLALVGESGSGKSSIVQLACRFYDPDMGKVDTGHNCTAVGLSIRAVCSGTPC